MSRLARTSTAALALALFVMGGSLAHADSSTIAHGLVPIPGLAPPSGPGKTNLPLLTPAQFAALQGGGGAPSGTPGAVAANAPGLSGLAPASSRIPDQSGTGHMPFTTARVAVTVLGPSTSAALTPVSSYPFRATGKLWAHFPGDGWYVCTGSMLRKAVLVTAAHCVFRYGKKAQGWADQVQFFPANDASSGGPYGHFVANASAIRLPLVYYNGNDTCAPSDPGVVCNNDLATVILAPRSGVYAGNLVGTYGWNWNGFSFFVASNLGNKTVANITQLGYPVAIDSGVQMERTDAVGLYVAIGQLKNTQIGSMQTGGSSGGPWLVNFGTRPVITNGNANGASFGAASASNVVVGVTSWGYDDKDVKVQGASFWGQNAQFPGTYGAYGAGNIGKIMHDTCTVTPSAC